MYLTFLSKNKSFRIRKPIKKYSFSGVLSPHGHRPFLKLNENIDGLLPSAEIISNASEPKTDSEIESWILSKFKGGIRRLKIFNDQSSYKFGETGNFNLWFFSNNANEATALAINHWNNNMYSVRFNTKTGPVSIRKMSSPDETDYVTILEQGTYRSNTEYTPANDPRKYTFFFGFISWGDVPVYKKQWHDSDNWHAGLRTVKINNNKLHCAAATMILNNNTGKITFEKFRHVYIDAGGFSYEETDELTGVLILGKN